MWDFIDQYGLLGLLGWVFSHDETWLVLMVLICGAILFEVLGKRWEKRNETEDTHDTE